MGDTQRGGPIRTGSHDCDSTAHEGPWSAMTQRATRDCGAQWSDHPGRRRCKHHDLSRGTGSPSIFTPFPHIAGDPCLFALHPPTQEYPSHEAQQLQASCPPCQQIPKPNIAAPGCALSATSPGAPALRVTKPSQRRWVMESFARAPAVGRAPANHNTKDGLLSIHSRTGLPSARGWGRRAPGPPLRARGAREKPHGGAPPSKSPRPPSRLLLGAALGLPSLAFRPRDFPWGRRPPGGSSI